MDFFYYLIKISVIALQIFKEFSPHQERDAQLSIANITTTTDLLSIDMSDQAKMTEQEQQEEDDSKALGATKTSGIIFLHGLGIKLGDGRYVMCNRLSGQALGLSLRRNKIVCPLAPKREAEVIRTIVPILGGIVLPGLQIVRSWFDFTQLPKYLIRETDSESESKPDLEEALGWVEEEIEKMIQEGIPSRNIVLSGMSQGGALTLYTALHTRYKLGGFLPIVTWLPLLKFEPPASLPTPINKDTPIFHMNGRQDLIVPEECGRATATAMEPVFTNYEQEDVRGTHLSTLGLPSNFPKIYCWLRNNVPNMAFWRFSPLRFTDCN